MALNGESIYGCGSAELPKPDWGWYTRRAGKLYAHVLEAPLGPLPLTGLVPAHIGAVRRLADGGEVVRGEASIRSFSHRVKAPSGADGAGVPKCRGRAAT